MSFGLTGIGALLTGGDIAGDTADIYGQDAVFGGKPEVAEFVPVDLAAEQARAVGGNIGNLAEIDKLLEAILPGYREMLTQGSKNTLALLHGEIPGDVQEKVRRDSAYQSLIGGYAGSGMAKALTARDFGLTSLDLMNRGENAAQNWSRMATGTAAPFMITPGQQAEVTAANNMGLQNTRQFQFNVDAAPDPAAAAKYAINSAIGMKLLDFGMGAAGGAMGGAGAAGGSAPATGGNWTFDNNTGRWTEVRNAQPASGSGGWWNSGR